MTEQQKKMAVGLGTTTSTNSKQADSKPIRITTCPIQKFQSAISGVGLFPPLGVVADGESRTFDTHLKTQKITAWYRLGPDLQKGCFGVAGLPVVWTYSNGNAQLATKPRMA
jgi:hypothetical protein